MGKRWKGNDHMKQWSADQSDRSDQKRWKGNDGMKQLCSRWFLLLLLGVWGLGAGWAGEWPRTMRAYHGTTPTLDGVLQPGEWDDATRFTGVQDWTPQFTPTTDPHH